MIFKVKIVYLFAVWTLSFKKAMLSWNQVKTTKNLKRVLQVHIYRIITYGQKILSPKSIWDIPASYKIPQVTISNQNETFKTGILSNSYMDVYKLIKVFVHSKLWSWMGSLKSTSQIIVICQRQCFWFTKCNRSPYFWSFLWNFPNNLCLRVQNNSGSSSKTVQSDPRVCSLSCKTSTGFLCQENELTAA